MPAPPPPGPEPGPLPATAGSARRTADGAPRSTPPATARGLARSSLPVGCGRPLCLFDARLFPADGARERSLALGPDLTDPLAAHALNRQRDSLDLHPLADFGNRAQPRVHETTERVHVLGLELQAQLVVGVVERDPGVEERVVRRREDHVLLLEVVVLIADRPNDLFDDVLDRDDPGGLAVLVDDDRHVDPVLLHVVEKLREVLVFGD